MTSRESLSDFQRDLSDHFTLERELPRGGMSRVFVATENALRRRVVVKVLSRELAASLAAERFGREIAIAARLQHPYIIPLLMAGEAGTRLYYTMPLVDGESLRERIDRLRPMPIEHIVSILEDVAGALAYAHAEGTVHRDIKPENVMFYHDHAVVLDFGIGKAVSESLRKDEAFSRFNSTTSVGRPVGTARYMAPEQIVGDPTLDHRADLYALGVVAYEMITGHPPFRGPSTAEIFAAHAKRRPDPITPRRPDVPAYLEAIVMRCLEKDPADRPSSGDEIVRALHPRPRSSGIKVLIARAPPWLPWAIAAAATLVAIASLLSRGRGR